MNQAAFHFETQVVKPVGLQYLLWLPRDAAPAAPPAAQGHPLILFLHGAGERGADLERVRAVALPRRLEERGDLPFIVVSPQCPHGSDWLLEMDALDALLKEIAGTYPVDPQRVYVTGMSMGGRATWHLAVLYPDRFAAIAPVCGRRPDLLHSPERIERLVSLPVWAFHGARDTVVPATESEILVQWLRESGGQARLTIYPDAAHDAWTRTYDLPELYAWLLEHTRPLAPA